MSRALGSFTLGGALVLAAPLPPRLRGVLRDGATRVEVEGCVPGFALEVVTSSYTQRFVPTSWRFGFRPHRPLVPGDHVRATLTPLRGSGFASHTATQLVTEIGATGKLPVPKVQPCTVAHRFVRVVDVPPGYRVDVLDDQGLLGFGHGGPEGVALVPVDPLVLGRRVVASITVNYQLVEAPIGALVGAAPTLSVPLPVLPIRVGQVAIRVANLVPAIRVQVELRRGLAGAELVFDGPAEGEVFTAWCTRGPRRARLSRYGRSWSRAPGRTLPVPPRSPCARQVTTAWCARAWWAPSTLEPRACAWSAFPSDFR